MYTRILFALNFMANINKIIRYLYNENEIKK